MAGETQRRVKDFSSVYLASIYFVCCVGLIMSIHLFAVNAASPQPSSSNSSDLKVQLLSGYENGSVTLWRFTRTDKQTSVEGIGWEAVWSVKLHVESGLLFQILTTISK
jgi:hypothetical protein